MCSIFCAPSLHLTEQHTKEQLSTPSSRDGARRASEGRRLGQRPALRPPQRQVARESRQGSCDECGHACCTALGCFESTKSGPVLFPARAVLTRNRRRGPPEHARRAGAAVARRCVRAHRRAATAGRHGARRRARRKAPVALLRAGDAGGREPARNVAGVCESAVAACCPVRGHRAGGAAGVRVQKVFFGRARALMMRLGARCAGEVSGASDGSRDGSRDRWEGCRRGEDRDEFAECGGGPGISADSEFARGRRRVEGFGYGDRLLREHGATLVPATRGREARRCRRGRFVCLSVCFCEGVIYRARLLCAPLAGRGGSVLCVLVGPSVCYTASLPELASRPGCIAMRFPFMPCYGDSLRQRALERGAPLAGVPALLIETRERV